ncbi:glycosyltransferase family 61 protein [Prosthecodimorpha staleyi]|uniref:Glycosyltransferase family 61 protein n=1 Tax=Prosthecodimorpha staleyi TaxID=2840188 RepID=A0A947GAW3_9HYPH|nr:glycosyltransferase family 61 protein [Prosthecodimorpha staleyi]MBT9289578.1 glycosyltransferase family 61 protein [Prosthecodimorpha staleyi]
MTLVSRHYRNVCLTPLHPAPDPAWLFAYAAYDDTGAAIEDLRFRRGHRQSQVDPVPTEEPSRLDGDHLFAGILFNHYGHFLLEGLTRLWALRRAAPDRTILWLRHHGRPMRSWHGQIFALFGIDQARFRFVEGATRIDRLEVPESGWISPTHSAPEYFDAIRLRCGTPVTPGRKVWLSRSRLADNQGRILGEAELEAVLRRRGWDIVHPETLSVAEQIDRLDGAEHIAGFEGSAFHTLLFMDVPGRVQIFARRRPASRHFGIIAEQKGFAQALHYPALDYVSGAAARVVSRLVDPDEVLACLVP